MISDKMFLSDKIERYDKNFVISVNKKEATEEALVVGYLASGNRSKR